MAYKYDGIQVTGAALSKESPFFEWFVESTLWFGVTNLKVINEIDLFKLK